MLKEFYAKVTEATAFVQQPEIFDEPYKNMADTKAGEASAQKELTRPRRPLTSSTILARSKMNSKHSQKTSAIFNDLRHPKDLLVSFLGRDTIFDCDCCFSY